MKKLEFFTSGCDFVISKLMDLKKT